MRAAPTLGRFSAGDALRGLSALGVLSLHFVIFALGGAGVTVDDVPDAMRSTYGPVGFLAVFGGLWLMVFFVLSGYLISRPFVSAYVHGGPRPDVRRYARNRFLRIAPAFWVAVLATLVAFGLMGSSPWVVALTLGFGQVFAVDSPFVTHIAQGWTLGAEMAFYLLVPAVALCGGRSPASPRARALRVLTLGVAMIALTIAWRSLGSEAPGWVWLFPAVAAFFVPGIALAVLETTWTRELASPRGRRITAKLAAPLTLAGLGLFCFAATSSGGPFTVWGVFIPMAGAGFLVAGPLLREWSGAPPWRLLRNRATDWLGERSYSIYVLHYGVGLWFAQQLSVSDHPWDTLLRFGPLALLTTLLLSDLSWRCVERPFLRMKGRRATGQAPAPTSAAEPNSTAEPSPTGKPGLAAANPD